jgi:DNA-binding Lrp family transcriptional regulator
MQELASKVGLSHTPCWRRYNRLKELGLIVGQAVMIDPKKVGLGVNAICDIVLQHHSEDALVAFEKAVLAHPEIVACFEMTGAKSMTSSGCNVVPPAQDIFVRDSPSGSAGAPQSR